MKTSFLLPSTLARLVLGSAIAIGAPALRAQSLTPELAQKVIQSVEKDSERLTNIFKDFHANPELGFMETRTAGLPGFFACFFLYFN